MNNEYKNLSKREMREAMESGKWLEYDTGAVSFLDDDHKYGPFVLRCPNGDENRLMGMWVSPCRIIEAPNQYEPIPEEWTHDWAKFRAVDKSGKLWEYEEKPFVSSGQTCWDLDYTLGDASCISANHDPTNWQDSLEDRPIEKKPLSEIQPFTKVLVRNNKEHRWAISFFGKARKEHFPFICINEQTWSYMALYEGNEQYCDETDEIPGSYSREDVK